MTAAFPLGRRVAIGERMPTADELNTLLDERDELAEQLVAARGRLDEAVTRDEVLYLPADAEVRRWALEAAVRCVPYGPENRTPAEVCLDAQVFEQYLRTGSAVDEQVLDDDAPAGSFLMPEVLRRAEQCAATSGVGGERRCTLNLGHHGNHGAPDGEGDWVTWSPVDDTLAVAQAAGVVPDEVEGFLGLGPVLTLLDLVEDAYPGPKVTTAEAATWSYAQRTEVHVWAAAAHLAASDNDVEVPPLPNVLTRATRASVLLDLASREARPVVDYVPLTEAEQALGRSHR